MTDPETYLYWASTGVHLVPLTFSVFYKAFNPQLKALFLYFILAFIVELIIGIYMYLHIPYSNIYFHIFTIIETSIIFFIYYKAFGFKNPYPMLLLGLAFFILAICKLSLVEYNDTTNSVESVIVILFSVIYFFKISNDMSIPYLTDFYFFWINSAFLFYFSTTFLLFLFDNYTTDIANSLWMIHNSSNIVYNILLTVGIAKTKHALNAEAT